MSLLSLLSLLRKRILFHHDFLVPALVPALVSLLVSLLVSGVLFFPDRIGVSSRAEQIFERILDVLHSIFAPLTWKLDAAQFRSLDENSEHKALDEVWPKECVA